MYTEEHPKIGNVSNVSVHRIYRSRVLLNSVGVYLFH